MHACTHVAVIHMHAFHPLKSNACMHSCGCHTHACSHTHVHTHTHTKADTKDNAKAILQETSQNNLNFQRQKQLETQAIQISSS